jgi:tetratricopeptide (TPR) repeat protein
MSLRILPVFVSSTWIDLQPERAAVKDAVLRLKETQFVGMEHFGSRDETPGDASLVEVEDSRIYVGIFAARYGSGITEAEYRRARGRGLPCFIYFKDDSTIPAEWRETDPVQIAKLSALKQELRASHIIGPDFLNPYDLAARVTADLHAWLFREYLTPILESAARGELPLAQAQALLSDIRDKSALSPTLVSKLTARHQLRAPVGDFIGREKEIAELMATLGGGGSAVISGISGMGGIGKTELALYVADKLRAAYPDAQLVVDMRGTDDPPRDPADALAACIRAFVGLEQKLSDDPGELTRLYRSVLEGKRALILLDNAFDGAQVRPLLPPAGSALLVTSRNAITGMARITLDQLQPPEARELLMGIAALVLPDLADQICYLCGYLPLAIRAAGSLLDVTVDLDPADYSEQLRDERTRLEHIGAEGVDISVEASFNLSYQRLSPEAARVFRQLAVFPGSFEVKAEEAVCADEKHEHLSGLVRRNLVLYSFSTGRYRLHDLVRVFASSRLDGDERAAAELVHATYYKDSLRYAGWLYEQGGDSVRAGLSLFDLERVNIYAGHLWAEQHAQRSRAAMSLCNEYAHVGGHLLFLRQPPRERIRWLEEGLAAARALGERTEEATHLGNLGIIYKNLGEPSRSLDYYEQALVILRETGDRRLEGNVLDSLGVVYKNLGDLGRAIDFYKQRIDLSREIGDLHGEGKTLVNLGNAHTLLMEYERAIEAFERALVIHRQVGDRYGEGKALANLGATYLSSGQPRPALEHLQQGLVISQGIGDSMGKATALINMGSVLKELGDHVEALKCAEASLEIFEQLESPNAERVRAILAGWRGQT